VQLVHLLMQVIVVLFGIGQLLLQLNLSTSQNVFFRSSFIPLMEHMDQHALTIPVCCSQPLNLLPSCLIPVEGLIPLQGQLCQLCPQPLYLTVIVSLQLTPVIVGLAKCTRHASQTALYSIKCLHHCKHGTHCRVVTVLLLSYTNFQRSSPDLLPRLHGGIAPRKYPSHSSCQLLRETIHDVPHNPKSSSVSRFLSCPAN
jgi:hypothetical protein